MPFVHGKNSAIWLFDSNGACQNMSADKNSILLAWNKSNPETTTFGKISTQRLSGLTDATLSGAGIWNSDSPSGLDTVLRGAMAASVPVQVSFAPAGSMSGCPMYSACYQLSKYEVVGPINGVTAINWEFQLASGSLSTQPFYLYLLNDQFLTNVTAPITSPRTSEPGTGQMLIVSDAGNRVAIANGQVAQTTGANDMEPYFCFDNSAGTGFARAAGLMLSFDIPAYQLLKRFGWSRARTADSSKWSYMIYAKAFGCLNTGGDAGNSLWPLTVDGAWTIYMILRGTGCFCFIKGTGYATPSLIWVDHRENYSPLWPTFPGYTGVATTKAILDNIAVRQLDGAFASDYGIATVNQTSPANGSNYSAVADGVHTLFCALPGSPTAGDYVELRFQVLDANNYCAARVEYNDGTSQWDAKLISVASGTPTTKTTKANVGNVTQIIVQAIGNYYTLWTAVTNTITIANSTINDTNQATQIGAQVNFINVTSSRYAAYPLTSSNYAALDAT